MLASGRDGVEWFAIPMSLFYSDVFSLPLPPGHPFPGTKYALLRERLLAGGAFEPHDFHVADPATDAEIERAHCPRYLERVVNGTLDAREIRAIGFPWSERMVQRALPWVERVSPRDPDLRDAAGERCATGPGGRCTGSPGVAARRA